MLVGKGLEQEQVETAVIHHLLLMGVMPVVEMTLEVRQLRMVQWVKMREQLPVSRDWGRRSCRLKRRDRRSRRVPLCTEERR